MLEITEQLLTPLGNRSEVFFEQPLTERMRIFLRLEFLYEQARFHMANPSNFSARATISSLLEILAILARGDVRAEVLKELERQSDVLVHFQRRPGVDPDRLNGLIADLADLKAQLTQTGSQFLQPLKDCDFLSMIKHRSAIPGGTCTFDIPDYGYWLSLPYEIRVKQIAAWMNPLSPLCSAVGELLWLAREANEPKSQLASSGFFQSTMDTNVQMSLVRVRLPHDTGLFPEISAGRHRFTVRFVEWQGVNARPVQTSKDVGFKLSLS